MRTPFSPTPSTAGTCSRRDFLNGLAAALALLTANRPLRADVPPAAAPAAAPGLPPGEPWATLTLVQEHLFPSEAEAPGASDINATAYLKAMLDLPDAVPEEKALIMDGAGWINLETANTFAGKTFADLNEDDREATLQRIAGSGAGQHWVLLLLYYIVEALLSDPVYGGNPGGIGWRWLKHTPGFPQPTAGSRYFELQARR
jgi:gluconate 2-dehydrogenase gamma chain